MPAERLIASADLLTVQLHRLAHQLVERHGDFSTSVLLGLQAGGAPVAQRLHALLTEILGQTPRLGLLDATFHRDDFRRRPLNGPLAANATRIDFALEGQRVILVDDVLFTGRTVRAALDALLTYGRPAAVELLVLIDRRHRRDLPIEATYVGLPIDTLPDEDVRVRWAGLKGADTDGIWLTSH
jgi:pyrimidine operon attenuation protein / uracil phosphoribosyltransferase